MPCAPPTVRSRKNGNGARSTITGGGPAPGLCHRCVTVRTELSGAHCHRLPRSTPRKVVTCRRPSWMRSSSWSRVAVANAVITSLTSASKRRRSARTAWVSRRRRRWRSSAVISAACAAMSTTAVATYHWYSCQKLGSRKMIWLSSGRRRSSRCQRASWRPSNRGTLVATLGTGRSGGGSPRNSRVAILAASRPMSSNSRIDPPTTPRPSARPRGVKTGWFAAVETCGTRSIPWKRRPAPSTW
jgi:hypothetical protein